MLCISLQSLSLDNPAHWLLCLPVLFPSHYLLILVLKFLDPRNSPRSVLIHLYTSTKSGETNVDLLRRLPGKSASTSRVIVLKQTSNSHSFTPVFNVPRPGIYPREDFSDDDHPLYHFECFQGRLSEPLRSFIAFASGSYESYSGSRVNVVDTLRDTVTLQLSLL